MNQPKTPGQEEEEEEEVRGKSNRKPQDKEKVSRLGVSPAENPSDCLLVVVVVVVVCCEKEGHRPENRHLMHCKVWGHPKPWERKTLEPAQLCTFYCCW